MTEVVQTIKATISTKSIVKAKVSIPYIAEMERYTGAYEVIPIFEDITLNTNGKAMVDDVKITSIPVKKVTNLSSGYTVIIGGEV